MSHKRKYILVFLSFFVISAAALFFFSKRKPDFSEPVSETGFYLNTVVTVTVYDTSDTALLRKSMEICRDYEKMLSRTIADSEISRFNRGELADAHGISRLSAQTAALVAKGLYYCELSGGAFDITIGPVSSLWDFTGDNPSVPDAGSIGQNLPLVGYGNLSLDGESLHAAREGIQLDLGAIAKGYIADRIKDYLVSEGVKSATINLGGNVLCIGSRPDGQPFRVGIQKPFAEKNETSAIVEISDCSVVTSGIYERCFEKDGILYHHILDPSTGYPCDNSLASVTIVSPRSVDGDGLSTSCFLLGLTRGMELVESLEDVEALFITRDGSLHYSSGFPAKGGITNEN